MEKPDIQSSSVESKEFFAGIKVLLEGGHVLLYHRRNLGIAATVRALTRRHSRYVNCELAECVVCCSELILVKKQKSQSCFSAPHILMVKEC